jgi:hypothetical protein
MPDINEPSDCPNPPHRLVTDRVLLKKPEDTFAWSARRANKMRERFPVMDHQPAPTMNLVAPVQPSITLSPFTEKPL